MFIYDIYDILKYLWYFVKCNHKRLQEVGKLRYRAEISQA